MEKYAILLAYFDKQVILAKKLYQELVLVDVTVYEKRYLFAMKVQQLYTALEDLFKQVAKAFENHIEEMGSFHKEMLARMHMEIPKMRPAVLSRLSFLLLDKLRAFRHFIRHAYDCELEMEELAAIQHRLKTEYSHVEGDLEAFRSFVKTLSM